MSEYAKIVKMIREMKTVGEKTQGLEYLFNALGKHPALPDEDKELLSSFVFSEASRVTRLLEEAESYREKDDLFSCADPLFGIVTKLYAKPTDMPEDRLEVMKQLNAVMDRERFLENAVDQLFEQPAIHREDVDRLLCFAKPLKDGYHKAKLWQGILHYEQMCQRLDDDARAALADFLADELEACLAGESADELEMAADAARLLMNDRTPALLARVVKESDHASAFYALHTLVLTGNVVEAGAVRRLAEDLEYASMTCATLRQAGKEDLFPSELTTPDYLAKSDLVHWLTYPTELGCVPDEIEYLGTYTKGIFRRETYHILRFRSASGTLSDDLKGEWLIGWSNDDGGTFSEFTRFAPFDTGDMKKTVKTIGKRLIK